MDKFFGLKRLVLLLVFACLLYMSEIFLLPMPAHADANSYQRYLIEHQVFTGTNSPAKNLQAGFYVCNALHAGQTPDQVIAGSPLSIADVRGMVDAAQHELCPDTLR